MSLKFFAVYILIFNTRLRIDDSRGGGGVVFQLSSQIKQHATPEHQMIMFLVPRNNENQLYMSFKQTCCLDLGLPSQCIKEAHFEDRNSHKLNSVLTKVAAQMNTKLGGELWGIRGVNYSLVSLLICFCFILKSLKNLAEKHDGRWYGHMERGQIKKYSVIS